MTDLDKLAVLVEAGEHITSWDIGWDSSISISKAVKSLDAARDLHDFMLPGWMATIRLTIGVVVFSPKGVQYAGDCLENECSEAAAWVAAILRAKAQENDPMG